jgi:hypothetical protein
MLKMGLFLTTDRHDLLKTDRVAATDIKALQLGAIFARRLVTSPLLHQ